MMQEIFRREYPSGSGRGLNGNVMGRENRAHKIILETFEIISIFSSEVTWSDVYKHGSVGMDIMKDYTIVLNYCKGYAVSKNHKDVRMHKSVNLKKCDCRPLTRLDS